MRLPKTNFLFALCYCFIVLTPLYALSQIIPLKVKVALFIIGVAFASVLIINIPKKEFERHHLTLLYRGYNVLNIFVFTLVFLVIGILGLERLIAYDWKFVLVSIVWIFLMEALLFWVGMIHVFLSSVQLGIKKRIMIVICGWIPVINLIALLYTLNVVKQELMFEYSKELSTSPDVINTICKTKYPLVFVHGVFFRDMKHFNYWGRIPYHLAERGAIIHYGKQESAQSVAFCGKQLSEMIRKIVEETDCGKVNIVAHSKGGLDSRYAISEYQLDDYVASLTTINTPHQGCVFADVLLKKIPNSFKQLISKHYNKLFRLVGDRNPDFLAAVTDLTATSCQTINKNIVESNHVYYQAYSTYMRNLWSAKFPLNLVYPLVKHFDGKNDGLVSVDSAMYLPNTTIISPKTKRGISHADVIDLYRENIPQFDVRKMYEDIVIDLKDRGF